MLLTAKFSTWLITISFLLAPILTIAQLEVYRTFDDLVNETPKSYDGYQLKKQKSGSNSKFHFQNPKTKDKVVVECSEVWGFSYKGNLFRTIRKGKYYNEPLGPNNNAVVLQSTNGVFLWKNISALTENHNTGKIAFLEHPVYDGFISESLNGEPAVIGHLSFVKSADRFFDDHVQLEWLRSCLRESDPKRVYYLYDEVLNCSRDHVPVSGDQ